MLKIILIFAELEREMTSERVTAVMLDRAENGLWNGNRPPLGYVLNRQTMLLSLFLSSGISDIKHTQRRLLLFP